MADVVWSGALERAAAERFRVYPTPGETVVVTVKDRVREWLHIHGEAAMPEIAAGLGADQSAVNSALYQLRQVGEIEVSPRTARGRTGRLLKFYRLTER